MTAPNQITRRSALGAMAAGLAAPFVWRHTAGAAPSETVLHASFGASGMAGSDIGSLTGQQAPQARRRRRRRPEPHRRRQEAVPGRPRLPGLARAARQGEGPQLGQRLDARPHARPDHHERHAARAARLHPEAAHADDLRGPAAREGRGRQEGRHPDGHPDPLGTPSTGRRRDRSRPGPIGKVKEVHSWSGKHWGDTEPAARPQGPRARRARLGRLARRRGRAAVHRRRLLPPGQLAEAARLRHRHVRRHGLPHPRPGVQRRWP